MRFLTVTVCAIVATLVAAAQVIALEETTLARRQASQSNSLVIVCPPGANTPCDQSVHVVSQTNATAAKNALDMCNAYDESQAGNHNPRVDSAGFDPKKATIMVCSDTYYHGACDHPTITDGECKQMTVGSLVGGPPIGGPACMSSMWVGDKVNHCTLSCGLQCEDIDKVGGMEVWGNIEDMTIGLFKPLNDKILSYKCVME